MRQVERNDSLPLRMVDSGVITEMVSNTSKGFAGRARDHSQVQEILDELETVTEQLDSTKQKLKKTEDQFQKSQTLVEDLERNLQKIDSHDTSQDKYGDDKALLRELEEIRAEIDAAKSEIQSECTSTVQQDLGQEEPPPNKELMKENSTLREEVACLRDILYDQDVRGSTTNVISEKATISKVLEKANTVHDQEMDALRAEFEKVSNENALLQEKMKKFINKNESSNFSNDEFDQLKEEIDRLNEELQMVEDDHRRATEDTEAFWRRKNQQEMRTEKSDPEDVRKLREAECSEMRSEILALTESLYDAQQNKTYLINELDIANQHNMDLQLQNKEHREITIVSEKSVDLPKMKQLEDALLDTQKVVEVKEKEIINLGDNLMSIQEEARLLSEEISHMSSAFEKAQEEYNIVIEELDTVGVLLEKSQKEAETCKRQIEIQENTTNMLAENEEERKIMMMQLEKAFSDNIVLQNKVDNRTEKIHMASKISYGNIEKPGYTDTRLHYPSNIISEIDDTQSEHKETMDALGRINLLLASVNFIERHDEIQSQTSSSNVTSTALKAEEIRRKVAFLIYALQKSKKEHSDVLLQLQFSKTLLPQNGVEETQRKGSFQQHNEDLQRKLEETESALAAAHDSKMSHEMKIEKLESETVETPEKNAEISLLRAQFKKLNKRNEDLVRQVKEAENEVLSVREKQDKLINDTQTRADMAKELQDEIDRASGEANKQNQEVDELTIMMENRMNLTEESLEMLGKEVSVVMKTLQTSQVVPNKEPEIFTPVLKGNSVSISDQYIRTQKNETGLTKSTELAVTKDQKTTNEWLVHKFQHEKDEKVKAAIAATMAYVFAASPKGNRNEIQDDVIVSSINENDNSTYTALTEIKDKGNSAGGNERESSFKDTDIHVRRNGETSPSLKSYKNRRSLVESKIDEKDRDSATTASVNMYDINRYIDNFKSNKNHERNIHKVANNFHNITLLEQDIPVENESRGDVGTEERE